MLSAAMLSFATGFLSLSLEILWIRIFGFTNHSLPQAFAFVLMFYLVGIAFGARWGKQFSLRNMDLWRCSGKVLIISSLFDLLGPLLYAMLAKTRWQILAGALLITFTAALKAIIFPIAHHLGVSSEITMTGKNISKIYVANIFGATLGPIVTGLVVLAYFTTQQSFILCALSTFLLACYCLSGELAWRKLSAAVFTASIIFFSFWQIQPHFLIARCAAQVGPIRQMIENQYGIIVTYADDKHGDSVYGGNVYDGRANLDPSINSNGINRVLILSAIQPVPTHVLMIGLSIGSWLKLVTGFPMVKNIDVVEINPGYLIDMKKYPLQQSSLADPRVHLYIDDGRHWLKTKVNSRYDLIIINATYHWRAYAGALLSQEFLQLLKQHMQANAVLTYNSTNSPDVLKTAQQTFQHAYLYENFIIAADFDWRKKLHSAAAEQALESLQLDGKPLFSKASHDLIHSFLNEPTVTLNELAPSVANRKIEVVTDANLITEYKYGVKL